MFNPISTYRIQFHKGFTFKDFDLIIPYLADLGLHTIYASPIMEAIPGSMHGYDTVNPQQINPEIGTLGELRAIAKKLKAAGMQWIQDIVPNHMAFHPDNLWLMDVLEKGAASDYADFFDINWSGDKNTPLMVPFLGTSLQEALENGELQLVERAGKIKLKYHETEWPVNAAVKSLKTPLKEVLDTQYYRLCDWKETNSQINFRRFFTVNGLICLNMQNEKVFTAYHQFLKTLLDEGIFQGLRVDHIDGLYDPETYLERLRKLAGEEIYIVAEKILEKGEELPVKWPVQGTTGYDFLAQLNNLFTDKRAKNEFEHYYQHVARDQKTVAKQICASKTAILKDSMAGELDNLYQLFLDLKLAKQEDLLSLKEGCLKEAIAQLLIQCPVYRFYGHQLPLAGDDYASMKKLLKKVRSVKSLKEAARLLEKVLLRKPLTLKNENIQPADSVPAGKEDEDSPEDQHHLADDYLQRAQQFYLRCMQFSGPLMAKGVEDTLMYTYNRFISHNEVGDAPDAFGYRKKVIHNKMLIRQKYWPLSLSGSSTHDTKRGEDVRARLNVLSDLPQEWIKRSEEWRALFLYDDNSLDPNDEYFIYQTIVGSYPMPGVSDGDYTERLKAYLEKALREGKRNSNWAAPDKSYEQIVKDFAADLLGKGSYFRESFTVFHRKAADFGILNSLAQLLLKFNLPGVPDVYQGTELWDLSLVDPDNRRPVDYQQRKEWLKELKEAQAPVQQFWEERYNGKIKLSLLHTLLEQRNLNAELYVSGDYIPLKVKGKYAQHVFAFARKKDSQWLITAIPLHLAKAVQGAAAASIKELSGSKESINPKNTAEESETAITGFDWQHTRIILPAGAPRNWKNLLTDTQGKLEESTLPVAAIFKDFPLALLTLEESEKERSAGILLSVTSLPSAYGIGGLGPEAEKFADFLSRSGQKYWQLLPLNPISSDQAFSPYSSVSAMAGNVSLISPELLVREGLLKKKETGLWKVPVKDKLNFNEAELIKNDLLNLAYENFKQGKQPDMIKEFAEFCAKEAYWLDDFALYSILKKVHGGLAWYEWAAVYRRRDTQAINDFATKLEPELTLVKWKQFIFFRQWAGLKTYVGLLGIKFYGDLPFYVSHDSVEVWANREIFSLDEEGEMKGVAGVPPDYFNADGQLWGMPVYRWEVLKQQGYKWWIQRIRKNMELYDLLRLDHFRAFADYWEVPAEEKTAVNGVWRTGPGTDFMEVLALEFPDMPFIAEDLGKISPAVYTLRDDFKLAGMKVLQFAFGQDMGYSEHIPHQFHSDNFVVYTGTHDNDTTLGWYEQETGKLERKHLNAYTGQKVDKKNVNIVLAQLAYSAVAKIAILPMQDILGLDGDSRMNKPASVKGNWNWRLKKRVNKKTATWLKELGKVYGRI